MDITIEDTAIRNKIGLRNILTKLVMTQTAMKIHARRGTPIQGFPFIFQGGGGTESGRGGEWRMIKSRQTN